MKVLISDPLAREGVDRLKEEDNIKVREAPGLSQEELIRTIPEYDALIVRSETKVTGEVIGAASRLKVIGRAG
ncbi:unnamed protein product, partial [marine sediment metagenome]